MLTHITKLEKNWLFYKSMKSIITCKQQQKSEFEVRLLAHYSLFIKMNKITEFYDV